MGNMNITHPLRMHFQLFEIVANEKLICKMLIKRRQLLSLVWLLVSILHSNSNKLPSKLAGWATDRSDLIKTVGQTVARISQFWHRFHLDSNAHLIVFDLKKKPNCN